MTPLTLGPRARALSLAAAAMIAVGACSSAATPVPPTAAPPTAAPATAAPASEAPATASPSAAASPSPSDATSSGTYTLTVVNGAGSLGKYMTGEDGKTLYTFKKDTAGNGKSACSGSCATTWPAFTLDDGEKAVGGDGVTGTIATIKRDDGKDQVTYNGAPLYYFSGDAAAGDTNGQGIAGIWFVAAP